MENRKERLTSVYRSVAKIESNRKIIKILTQKDAEHYEREQEEDYGDDRKEISLGI